MRTAHTRRFARFAKSASVQPFGAAMPDPYSTSLQAIAFVRSPYAQRIDAPHQSTVVEGTETGTSAEARIEFIEGFAAQAYRDLQGFERIWLIFAFHRSEGWKAEVRPPRGGGKRSVLATRSPHRPNAIGLSAVELRVALAFRRLFRPATH